MGEVLGEFRCELDGRFSSVRTAETNLGIKTIQRKSRLTVPVSDFAPTPPPPAPPPTAVSYNRPAPTCYVRTFCLW